MEKGILMLNFHYTDASGISIPLGYEIITKTEEIWNEEYQKHVKKSLYTKNEIMQDKLNILYYHNEVKFKYILFDKWFASTKNLVFIEEELKKKFVCPIKSNRKVAFTLEERNNGKYVNISSIDIEGGSSRLVYLEGYKKPLRLIKQVVKNGDDGESIYLYLVTNDIDLSFNEVLKIYKRRWKVEEYHKSLKQNLKIEHSPTKVEKSQRNHIHLAVRGFIKLEKLRLNYKMNHFAIKEKIYLEALKVAYAKVGELMVA
ncbi:MAG: transposase [Sulfurimonas sp.]|nr:transposase [Sulfurimonas sp.]